MMALVLFQRLLNFGVNQLLLRRVDPNVLGLTLGRCDLVLSSTLFLGREGLRLALVRQSPGSAKEPRARQTLVNLAWLSAPLGLGLSVAVALAYGYFSPDSDAQTRKLQILYCGGGALEVRR